MLPFYDLIIGLCSHKSAKHTLNLMESANNIEGDILFVVTTSVDEDVKQLTAEVSRIKKDLVVCKTSRNSRYFCNNWAFIGSLNNGIQSKFFGTMDDDILFMDGHDFIDRLYKADDIGFSVLGFWSSSHGYPGWGVQHENKEYRDGLIYVDGHNMFTHFTDNILYGLCDSWGTGNVSYVEIEYCTRMKHFTQKPILADASRLRLYHIFRKDEELNDLRKVGASFSDMNNGINLFREKYGIEVNPLNIEYKWQEAVDAMNSQPDKMEHHVLYDGMWNNWSAIYDKFSKEVACVYQK